VGWGRRRGPLLRREPNRHRQGRQSRPQQVLWRGILPQHLPQPLQCYMPASPRRSRRGRNRARKASGAMPLAVGLAAHRARRAQPCARGRRPCWTGGNDGSGAITPLGAGQGGLRTAAARDAAPGTFNMAVQRGIQGIPVLMCLSAPVRDRRLPIQFVHNPALNCM